MKVTTTEPNSKIHGIKNLSPGIYRIVETTLTTRYLIVTDTPTYLRDHLIWKHCMIIADRKILGPPTGDWSDMNFEKVNLTITFEG